MAIYVSGNYIKDRRMLSAGFPVKKGVNMLTDDECVNFKIMRCFRDRNRIAHFLWQILLRIWLHH
jgi:hypothetical protein